jgi:hypothetical protein
MHKNRSNDEIIASVFMHIFCKWGAATPSAEREKARSASVLCRDNSLGEVFLLTLGRREACSNSFNQAAE